MTQEDFDGLERENLRLRAALEEKSTLIEVAQSKIEQSRVQLRHAEDAAAKAMSRAASALALSQSEAGCGQRPSCELAWGRATDATTCA